MDVDLAFGIQELYASAGFRMCDRIVSALFVVAHSVEARRRRWWPRVCWSIGCHGSDGRVRMLRGLQGSISWAQLRIRACIEEGSRLLTENPTGDVTGEDQAREGEGRGELMRRRCACRAREANPETPPQMTPPRGRSCVTVHALPPRQLSHCIRKSRALGTRKCDSVVFLYQGVTRTSLEETIQTITQGLPTST
jgi:hypothetical protein